MDINISKLVNLEEQVIDQLGKEMQVGMDFEILADVMCGGGWTCLKMQYNPHTGQEWSTVIDWVDNNFEGDYREHNGTWLIELKKDATMLALKWKCN